MVQITIDTSRDSKEEIRHAIKFLQESIGEITKESSSDSITNEEVNDMFSMFGNNEEQNNEDKPEKIEESDSVIEIVEY